MKEKAMNKAEKQRLERAFKVLDNPIFSLKPTLVGFFYALSFVSQYSANTSSG